MRTRKTMVLLSALAFGGCSSLMDGSRNQPGDASPAEFTVAVGNASAVFKRIDPTHHGIRYPVFYMLETEVTNAQFKEYLAATGAHKDDMEVLKIVEERESGKRTTSTARVGYSVGDKKELWRSDNYPDGMDDHPVALVPLSDAELFCKWLTKKHPELGLFRLPTWNEWMIAAYGRDRNYPWGNEWQNDRIHMAYGTTYPKFPDRTEPVKARPKGQTPEGLYGMLGNVEEYISEADPTRSDYFNLGSRWMGGGFSTGTFSKPGEQVQPRKDYWGYSHLSINQEADLGFRVLLDRRKDMSLLQKARLFDQKDTSWMCAPKNEKENPNKEPATW